MNKKRTLLTLLLVAAMALPVFPGISLAGDAQELRTVKLFGTDYRDTWNNFLVADSEKYYAYQELARILAERGVKLEWETVPTESIQMVLQTRLASGEKIADIIHTSVLSDVDVITYGKNGMFIELLSAFEQYDKENSIIDFFHTYFPSKLELQITADNELWWVPYVYSSYYVDGAVPNATEPWTPKIRKDWLDACGIEWKYSYSTDELFDILTAFRDNKVNGRGFDINIGVPLSNFGGFFTAGLSLAFNLYAGTFSNLGYGIERMDGTKEWGCVWESKYIKEYLQYLNKLYEAGFYDTDLLNDNSMGQMRNENRGALCYDYAVSSWEEDEVLDVEEALYLPTRFYYNDIENGIQGMEPTAGSVMKWSISGLSDDVGAAVEVFKFVFTTDYAILNSFGVEGKSFHWDDQYGVPVSDLKPDFYINNEVWEAPLMQIFSMNMLPAMALTPMSHAYEKDVKYPEYVEKNDQKQLYRWNLIWDSDEKYDIIRHNLAYSVPTNEEVAVLDRVSTTLDTYSNELLLDMITGAKSVDDLDQYITEMKGLGLDEFTAIMKARFDRAYNK